MSTEQPRRRAGKHSMKLSTTVTLMLCGVIGSVLLVVYVLYFLHISNVTRSGVKDTAFAVARTLAEQPALQHGLTLPPARNPIQAIASEVEKRNSLLFVVITDMHGIRYSHPNPATIGSHFIGDDLQPALAGKENVSINHGVLAEALRVFTPIYDDHQRQIGVVAIGISLEKVQEQISRSRWSMLWTVLFSALMGSVGTWALVRILKRILFGLEPYEISALFEQRQAMLQSIKEGVIAVDYEGRVTLTNHAARSMLLSPDDFRAGKGVPPGPLVATLREVLESGTAIQDREIISYGRRVLCNAVPVRSHNQIIGAISTFRDKTEIDQLTQRVDGMVNYVDALRERSHEFMNKLHVILGLLQLKRYDKLQEYILQTADNYQVEIGTLQSKIQSPVIAGFLIGKINRAREAGFQLTLADECFLPDNQNEQQVMVLITVLGNLIENALDAMQGQSEGEVHVLLHYQNGVLSGEVSDDGPGIAATHIQTIFEKGFSTKGEQRGVGLFLAKQQLEQLGGTLLVESEPDVFTQFFVQLPWDSERNNA